MERALPGIIDAKIRIPPERDGMLRRVAVIDELATSTPSVVMVHAPAGFGKSTVLEQWAHHDDRQFAWVSLDPSENDPTVFWRHIYAALQVCMPGFAQHLSEDMATAGPDLVGSIIPDILNELEALDEPVVIVLDDYHRLNSPEVDSTVRLFIRHLPAGTTVAVGTRTRPDLELARLRSRGRIRELDAQRLSLTFDETGAILRAQDPQRTDEDIAWIHARTEGWPAGVYLFGLVDAIDTSAGTTSDIRDYLMTEMLSNLDDQDLRFMRETAILSHLEAGSCDYLTNEDSGQSVLERLAASNLLIIPLDDVGDQFRYHHLLQDDLISRLSREASPETIAALHHRAMEWATKQGEISEAIHHAVRAGEAESAVTLVAENWYEYTMSGRVQSAYQWLDEFADHDFRTRPRLMLAGAMLSAFSNHPERARELAVRAEETTSAGEGLAGAATYESSVAIMRASIVADGPVSALADARKAAEIEPNDSPYRPLLAAMIGTFIYSTSAHDTEAYPLLLEGTKAATGPPETAAYALANLALMHSWRNDADAALSYARQAIARIDETKVGGLLVYGPPYAVAARFSVESDGLEACNTLMKSAEQAERTASNGAPFDSMVLRTTMAEAYVAMEEYGLAREYAERALTNLATMREGGLVATRLDTVIRLISQVDQTSGENLESAAPLLSPREIQILSLLTTDETLEGIGRRLYVSRNTVKTHTARIYRKLGVSDRRQAVAAGRRLSLI